MGKIKIRNEMIAEMPDSIIPMDFHLYKIRIDDDFLEMEIDYTWNIFGMSYSGNKAVMKKFKKISRDLYSYYGVTEEDIKNKTKIFVTGNELEFINSYFCENEHLSVRIPCQKRHPDHSSVHLYKTLFVGCFV